MEKIRLQLCSNSWFASWFVSHDFGNGPLARLVSFGFVLSACTMSARGPLKKQSSVGTRSRWWQSEVAERESFK